MKKSWNNITAIDVKKAIELFDKKNENYPEPRNTFLIYNDKKYPAKHIRGLAYLIANKEEISKSEYNGGEETVNFLTKLGFTVQYKNRKISQPIVQKEEIKLDEPSISDKQVKLVNHKIARLIVIGDTSFSALENLIVKFLSTQYGKTHFEFILTPGGFLTFDFPNSLRYDLDIPKAEEQSILQLQKEANNKINEFFSSLPPTTFKKLKETADFFTIGIDGKNPINDQNIELVAIYDLKKEKVVEWTGKFYPIDSQRKILIKINNLDTHFVKLNNQRVLILGCHDLNVYNPRGQAAANPDGWKKQLADKFKALCKKFDPEIILQHPHTTDTPNIWNLAWGAVEKELPNVKHFASGINYSNGNEKPRGELSKVLEKTKKGDVIDFYYG